MSVKMPASCDWPAVDRAVMRLRAKHDLSVSALSRRSGVSETTIRYLGRAEPHNRATLAALSGALSVRYGYLGDVAEGNADPDDDQHYPSLPDDSVREIIGSLREIERHLRSARGTSAKPACVLDSLARMKPAVPGFRWDYLTDVLRGSDEPEHRKDNDEPICEDTRTPWGKIASRLSDISQEITQLLEIRPDLEKSVEYKTINKELLFLMEQAVARDAALRGWRTRRKRESGQAGNQ